ncbi:DNA primase [Kribbella italica]|uniref:DNA primase n=1 Tax=Kribbella italica TaxID=1540520 RepID=A0A7W9J0H7_9ACTN|nr:toprim domain-containing protein [Kribbella italica]MBB5833389.1 DNA primase [Kribbella italica]
MELLEEATSAYQAAVTPAVARYLLDRGISREAAVTNRLGVVSDPFPGHGKFQGFLAIPYLDKDGRPLTIRFRCLQDHNCRDLFHGKYMTIADDIPRMYGIGAIHLAGDEIHVCEGELDAVVLRMLGLHAVAVPGAKMWANRHRRMLAGFSRVYVWADPDDAGAELTAKITRALRSAKPVRLTADVTDTYLAGGADAIFAALGREAVAA